MLGMGGRRRFLWRLCRRGVLGSLRGRGGVVLWRLLLRWRVLLGSWLRRRGVVLWCLLLRRWLRGRRVILGCLLCRSGVLLRSRLGWWRVMLWRLMGLLDGLYR